jgi:regulator of replication initiation timing
MATVEALRTRLDALQWENNRLEAENRRLREEHPEENRVLMFEAELEQSKNEVARTG